MPNEPPISKIPTAIFGYPCIDHGNDARNALITQHCPFLNDTCKKPRKSEPHIKIGVCSVGYKGKFLDAFRPIVICPHRFHKDEIFRAIERLYLSEWNGEVDWVSEVSIGVGGSVDYVAAKLDAARENIDEFL